MQVSAFYDQTTDVPAAQVANLPANAFVALVVAQQPIVENIPTRDDQVAIIAVGLPTFVLGAKQVALDPSGTFDATVGPTLVPSPNANGWLVTAIDGAAAGARLWQMLQDPRTSGK